ncbi:hypothetical protein RhiirA4_469578 [Rhizophagus irregularis]|uniref:Uncharacterized protein n=1 Tax=Rhizophagus irregularis TaxID=588596 RepID=A0A2I1GZZ5_9GLOM|nr:hypothetical protein RhiirA4_469578 [Rhizophagus irregularis]
MTGYNPEIKENIREITVYDIPSRWTQLDWTSTRRHWIYGTVELRLLHLEVVLIGVPATTNIATLYPDNPAHSILTPTGCKAFKLIQDRGTRKLITYYESWADLDKVIAKKEPTSEGEVR